MPDNSVLVEYQRFEDLNFDIITQCTTLSEKRERIDETYHGGELQTVWMMESWSAVDDLQHKHCRLQSDRKKMYTNDITIIELYLKVLSCQSEKIHSFQKRLAAFVKRNPSTDCPADYSIQTYEEWARTCPKIHALQSQILDLLSQKIKLCHQFLESEKSSTPYHTLHYKSISTRSSTSCINLEKLRSQTYFFIERDPLVDSDFSLFVNNLLTINTASFEAIKIREFISYCWDKSASPDFCIEGYYQEFVGALVEHILTKYGHRRRSGAAKVEITRDQLFTIVESHIIPHILDCVPQQSKDDSILMKQYKKYSQVKQAEIGVQTGYIDHSLWPYHEAIIRLKTLPLVQLPTQKLRTIILASHAAMKRMAEVCDEEKVAGADEFIDVWVYIVFRAGVQNLSSDLNFIKDFCNPSYMLSETGYYLSSLELATEFIKTFQETDIVDTIDGQQRQNGRSKSVFLSAQIHTISDLVERGFVEVINNDFELTGYELYGSFKALQNPCRVGWTVFVKNDRLLNPIKCVQYKLKKPMNEKRLQKILFGADENIVMKTCNCITVNVQLPVRVEKGDMSDFVKINNCLPARDILLEYTALLWFGVGISDEGDEKLQDIESLQVTLAKMRLKYKVEFSSIVNDATFQDVIKNIAMLLCKAGYHSKLLNRNQRCTSLLEKSLKKFQLDYNKAHQSSNVMLRTDGKIDVITLKALQNATRTC